MVGVRYSPYDQTCRDRKERKPVLEKLRRERMNNSISQLKELIATTIQRHASPMTRVDKADILEYTVIHLQQLQQQQQTICGSSNANVSQFYDAGFKDCAREAVTFLNNSRLADDNTANDVSNHLYMVYKTGKEPYAGSPVITSSGPCLSTPVRIHDTSRLQASEKVRFAANCSPIKSQLATSPNDVASLTPPDIVTPRLGDLSFNTLSNILNTPDTSSSDVSMESKETSSLDSNSFCSRKLSNLFDSTDKFPLDLSLGSVLNVIDQENVSDKSGSSVSNAPAGHGIDVSREIKEVDKSANFESPWRPW